MRTALKHLKEHWLNGLHDVDTLEPLRSLTLELDQWPGPTSQQVRPECANGMRPRVPNLVGCP